MCAINENGALIAMSGGVDSSVAAHLMLKQGYTCVGTTMRLYRNEDICLSRFRTCCSQRDIDDAAEVAFELDMPYEVLDYTKDFKAQIIGKFIRVYESGGTPNPCIDCNRYMKFEKLLHAARDMGLNYIVTGHYARIEHDEASRRAGGHIISTPLEHASVTGALSALEKQGCTVDLVDIKSDGTIDLDCLRDLLRDDTVLVAVCAVDSELGTVQPIREIAEILKGCPGCHLHVDATQAVGKAELVIDCADTVSIAPHKFYGLNGSGLLIKKRGAALEPQIHGGGSTTPYRSGTPTLGLAAATETALRLALDEQERRIAHVTALNRRLHTELAKYPAVRINSPDAAVPHILNLSVAGVKGTAFQRSLAECGVCVSVKSACSSDGAPSKAVFAVSGDRKIALSSWRISLSHLTTQTELTEFLQIFDRCYHELVR